MRWFRRNHREEELLLTTHHLLRCLMSRIVELTASIDNLAAVAAAIPAPVPPPTNVTLDADLDPQIARIDAIAAALPKP